MGIHGGMVINKIRTSSTIMKFREWIRKIEEAGTPSSKTGQRPNLSPGGTKPDMTSYRGIPYGWEKTQIPYAKSFDNPAVIALPAGVGSGVDDEMKRMGRDFSPSVRVSEFPTELKPLVNHGSLPLQYPAYMVEDNDGKYEFDNQKYQLIPLIRRSYNFSGINFQNVSKSLTPENLRKIRTIDDNPEDWWDPSKFIAITDETELESREIDFNDIEIAKLFTRYAIQTMIVADMLRQNQNIVNKYNIMKPVLEYETLNSNILVCAFSFKPVNEGLPSGIRGDE